MRSGAKNEAGITIAAFTVLFFWLLAVIGSPLQAAGEGFFSTQEIKQPGFNDGYGYFFSSSHILAGVGFIGHNLSMGGFGSNFNCMPNVGSSIQYCWDSCNAVNFEWRYEYLANGGIEHAAAGLNLNTFLIGYSHSF